MKKSFILLLFSLFIADGIFSQQCSNMNILLQADIASTCNQAVMTMMHDELNRPYLYVANKEAGLKIYNISNISAPVLTATLPVSLYDSLDVMNLSQSGNYVYLALGNTFNDSQESGMAIVDVTNPATPAVTDYYSLPNSKRGSGIVKAEGNYAYLGAMPNGLVILDITDKNNIQFVSQFIPDINYPPITNPDSTKINARGMEVKNSIVYLCHDAGGLRIINCTNKSSPVETGHWCNPVMYTPFNKPRAYNNIAMDDTLAYIAVDYCGMEVLNIADTSNITLVGWWNPYNCPNNNWFSSPVHANEIHYDKNCKQAFLSTGKSDMMVVDVSNPVQPDSCNFYGGVSNNIGTWGVGLYEDEIYLSYICTLGIPFASNWTGLKILTYNACAAEVNELREESGVSVYPNPGSGKFELSTINEQLSTINIYNVLGDVIYQFQITQLPDYQITIDLSNKPDGIYFYRLITEKQNIFSGKILISR